MTYSSRISHSKNCVASLANGKQLPIEPVLAIDLWQLRVDATGASWRPGGGPTTKKAAPKGGLCIPVAESSTDQEPLPGAISA
jgi:hypothetical protein